MKLINVNVGQIQVFPIISKGGIKTNADFNTKNSLTKKYVMKDLFGILVIVIVNVINHVMLENIQIIKIANAETNQLKNVKMLMEMKWLRM